MTPAVVTHDPLCPTRVPGHQHNTACWCDEIARVRADEREAAGTRVAAAMERPYLRVDVIAAALGIEQLGLFRDEYDVHLRT